MMYSFRTVVLMLLALAINGCKKDNTTPLDFSKLTTTDIHCVTFGDPDSTDWTFDSYWTAQESALLKFNDTLSVSDTLTGWIEVSAPCPNPGNGIFILGVNSEYACKMKLVCVNTEMQILYYSSEIFHGGVSWIPLDLTTNTAFRKSEYYRLYYSFSNAQDSVYYKGHGDIRIE